MRSNNEEVSGVFYQQASAKHYDLRRYYPQAELAGFIEQFWFVDWHLSEQKVHTQKNLPDPNFHLVIESRRVRVMGPVSKVYAYDMCKQGRVLGVKFKIASILHLLKKPLCEYVDTELPVRDIFGETSEHVLLSLYSCESDRDICNSLSAFLKNYTTPININQSRAVDLCALIKNDSNIFTVEALSEKSNLSKRTIQRIFNKYVGLTPKWLIRKYRLHQVLQQFDQGNLDILDIVSLLEYTDQAHLIRDFREVIGVTPGQYVK
ncbi:helix-turn-helix domain-containing protein [Pseudoalteromonas luteoviolacea]|uniref:HTH araC/xylS-type domain-containing protein n=1 Tax=Pseudoalteromonas luteoviolacea S4054 TaxID=1129367 RepID=A0A0F6AD26_9GAMM|nr:AraC family transcriptional regulator [Pseudoalteromonas luteoviolacea]AOT10628.1 hypothetical protein S4054249_22470 [Pseudoalteromonas luteoviolacea]AOT15304.1 hypothetical protein S40542_21125 [Pseudoalteromonas luteoviolacea]AOT20447.1 hypothetical protein S4054_22385 [Pseudoalteromonas luteoviolacea]KKE83726.1 hypothetical protein N479_12935 [Pseudoalteromonas luteoviolacea S4054]KZN71930.1 hypothetical protein N481_17300 [Pseudoalteromonas luteoviolacea S4047-1]